MTPAAANLAAWSLQAALVIAAAALATHAIRLGSPGVRYAWWRRSPRHPSRSARPCSRTSCGTCAGATGRGSSSRRWRARHSPAGGWQRAAADKDQRRAPGLSRGREGRGHRGYRDRAGAHRPPGPRRAGTHRPLDSRAGPGRARCDLPLGVHTDDRRRPGRAGDVSSPRAAALRARTARYASRRCRRWRRSRGRSP